MINLLGKIVLAVLDEVGVIDDNGDDIEDKVLDGKESGDGVEALDVVGVIDDNGDDIEDKVLDGTESGDGVDDLMGGRSLDPKLLALMNLAYIV